MHLSLARSI